MYVVFNADGTGTRHTDVAESYSSSKTRSIQ